MFISHKYKTIFVHIQKTGGNSVEDIFRKKDRKIINRISVAPEKLRSKHCYISDIKEIIEQNIFYNYTKFCIVRNPFDRMVSWYSMFKYETGIKNDVMIAVNKYAKTFSDFVMLPDEGIFHRFYVNQLEYISVDDLIAVDEILRFENLTEDFEKLKQKIHFKGKLPHKNKSVRKTEYQDYYDDNLKKIIFERFKKDFDFFNYTF